MPHTQLDGQPSGAAHGLAAPPADRAASLEAFVVAATEAEPTFQPLLLIEEISHRVVNEYAEAVCSLSLAAAASRDPRVQFALTTIANKLRAQAEAHRALAAPPVDGPMNVADYVAQLCGCMAKSMVIENDVRLSVSADEIWLDSDRCWRVGLIVAELVRNAARHGLSERPGHVWVEIADASGHLVCKVTDDGRPALFGRPGRGRRLVQALAAELNGYVDWTFGTGGCCVRLEIPAGVIPIDNRQATHRGYPSRPGAAKAALRDTTLQKGLRL